MKLQFVTPLVVLSLITFHLAQAADAGIIRSVGICHPAPNHEFNLENVIEPKGEAQDYLWKYEHRKIANNISATITVQQQPKHGVLRRVTEADIGSLLPSGGDPLDPAAGLHFYLPSDGYLGKDKAVFLVEIAGIRVKVVYFFQAVEGAGDVSYHCKKTGYSWKISPR